MRTSSFKFCCLAYVSTVLLAGCSQRDREQQANSDRPAAPATTGKPAAPAGILVTDAAVQQQVARKAEVAQQGGRLEVKLDYAGTRFTDDDLAKAPLNDAVTEIDLRNTQITDDGLAHLKRAPNLTSVNLDDTNITDKGLEHLKELPKLQWVELMGNDRISREAYESLQQLLAPRRPM